MPLNKNVLMGHSGPYLFSTSFRLTSQLVIQTTHQILDNENIVLHVTIPHLKVYMYVISQDVHTEEPAATDLTGVFLVPVG